MTDAETHCRNALDFTRPNTEGPHRICEVAEPYLRALLDEVTRLTDFVETLQMALNEREAEIAQLRQDVENEQYALREALERSE